MLSQVAGAASSGGTPLEATPTDELQLSVASRKTVGGTPTSKNSASGTAASKSSAGDTDVSRNSASDTLAFKNFAGHKDGCKSSASSSVTLRDSASGAAASKNTASGSGTSRNSLSGAATSKNSASGTAASKNSASGAATSKNSASGAAASKNSANLDFQFFFEDEVFRIDRKGRVRFGVVTGTAESYSSEDEEEEENEVLGKGEVRCAFYPDGKEIVRNEKSIGLCDRTLMPGDVVRRRLPGQKQLSGQAGYVRDVNVCADVKVLGTQYVIRNVPSERLRPISEWSRDVPVCLGNWIGYTMNVNESAVLKSKYGALLEITSNDFHKFKDAYGPSDREVFSPSVYYPNNVIVGRLPPLDRVTNLTPTIPLPTNRKRRNMYTVESVKTTAVTVAWTFKSTAECESGTDLDSLKEPKTCIKGDDLANVKRLNIYESYMLQIHDRFYLKYSKCDKLVKSAVWEQEQDKLYKTIYQRQKSEENKQCEEQNVQDRQNLNSVSVEPENLPSPSAPSSSRNAHMFKLRRLNNKPSSHRSRSLSENEASYSTNATSGKKMRANNDGAWDTVDDDADADIDIDVDVDEEVPAKTTELAELSCVTTMEEPMTPVKSYASQAARLITRNFKRRHSKKRLRPSKKAFSPRTLSDPKDGDEMVVETLVVYSSLTVVWQDGSVETSIPSTELYPIHHLDNHEFFPGDFVSKANDYSPSQMDYGVIQSVDHDERIAKVKWFNIYGNMDNPVPLCKEVEELSVYDLKDHADYQYRPGTMVIRVSNFTGEDLNSTAGQVIDNFPDGRVRVWWAKGHITMCYPQDLFEIHHSDTQDPIETDESDNSWETQSENSQSALSLPNMAKIILGIDGAKQAVERLEKIFHVLPDESKALVIHDLMAIYKSCRYLDGFLDTDFFHEDHFHGIVSHKEDQVKAAVDASTAKPPQSSTDAPQAMEDAPLQIVNATQANANAVQVIGNAAQGIANADQVFADTDQAISNEDQVIANADQVIANVDQVNADAAKATADVPCAAVVKLELPTGGQTTSTPNKRKASSTHVDEVQCKKNNSSEMINVGDPAEQAQSLDNTLPSENKPKFMNCDDLLAEFRSDYNDIMKNARAAFAKAFERRKHEKNDSGVYSRGENSSSDFTVASDCKDSTEDTANPFAKPVSESCIKLMADPNADVCEVFFFLLKEQIIKCKKGTQQVFRKERNKQNDAFEQQLSDADANVDVDDADDDEEQLTYNKDQEMEQPLNLNALSESLPPLESPTACSSPSPMQVIKTISNHCFEVAPNAPSNHHFIANIIHPTNKSQYQRAVQREYAMLHASLPPGVFVRAFEDRMDLMSVMMVGPKRTPYQNALFYFDFQMGSDYPKSPPTCHYISYCTERLNPNLYEEGKVCVSLLGTWSGRDNEVWTPRSTMLQVLVSIQGLILVDEPYYNEAGYEKQRGTQLGNENSRVYNEMAIIKIVHSTVKQLQNPPLIFRKELIEHFKEFGSELYERMYAWSEYSAEAQRLKIVSISEMPKDYKIPCEMPEFPLLPCSRGFCIAVRSVLKTLQTELDALKMKQDIEPIVTVAATAPRAAPEDV